jgi:hypothetical protein
MRGWIGVVLLVVAAASWALIESGESSQPSSLPMFLTFLLIAPVAIVYSFRARRLTPDRVVALVAFVGSFVVGAFLLFMLEGQSVGGNRAGGSAPMNPLTAAGAGAAKPALIAAEDFFRRVVASTV